MKNLKIGVRLGLGFATVLLLLVILASVAIIKMEIAGGATSHLINVSYKNVSMVAEWSKIIELNVLRSAAMWKSTDATESQLLLDEINTNAARSLALQQEIEGSLRNPVVIAEFNKVKQQRSRYVEARSKMLKAKADNDSTAGNAIFHEQVLPASATYLASIRQLAITQSDAAKLVASNVLSSYANTRIFLIVMGTLALLAGIASAYFATRSITIPIASAVQLAQAVADGDLRSLVQVDRKDEMGSLMQALQSMNSNLLSIVSKVLKGTENIAAASAQIAAGNLDLSARTEQQASSLEETASSMEELTATVKQNVEHARHASTLAKEASAIAEKGGTMVSDVIGTMAGINASSRRIVDIISVIDGIAFQTNILALNAAVEAARAGEQGRGFAVVASEVRNLAQRSASAAKEVKLLIDDSVHKVDTGSALVQQTGGTMEEIIKSVAGVTETIRQISEASTEQSAGIEQINQAVTEMDQVTQQNAALVEEAAAASAAMQEQATELAQLMSVFKTHHEARNATARTPVVTQHKAALQLKN